MQNYRSLTRRALMIAAAGTVAALAREAGRAAQPVPPYRLSCAQHPGVQLLLDWRAARPVMTLDELLPPPGWQPYSHPTMPLFFLFPADWRGEARWAETLTAGGSPVWLGRLSEPELVRSTVSYLLPTGESPCHRADGPAANRR